MQIMLRKKQDHLAEAGVQIEKMFNLTFRSKKPSVHVLIDTNVIHLPKDCFLWKEGHLCKIVLYLQQGEHSCKILYIFNKGSTHVRFSVYNG